IIHGTDTMVYTASALSFALMNLPKPVILTGAQRPIAEIRTDAKSNLVNSIEMATYDIPEVGLYFNNQLFRGNRAKKISIDHFDAFASPNYPQLASVGLKIQIHHGSVRRPTGLFRVQKEFVDKVLILRLFPGMSPEYLLPLLDSSIEAFLIEAYGAGNVPILEKSLVPFIERATEKKKIVALSSQSFEGSVDLELYECGTLAAQAGAISCGDMTTEAAAVKMMFLLGQLEDTPKVKKNFNLPLAGEITRKFNRRAQDRE
ncbi:MAG TPA: asparaginase, partial [Chroococcales cyanobacterium]